MSELATYESPQKSASWAIGRLVLVVVLSVAGGASGLKLVEPSKTATLEKRINTVEEKLVALTFKVAAVEATMFEVKMSQARVERGLDKLLQQRSK
jgi:hypothetical protein